MPDSPLNLHPLSQGVGTCRGREYLLEHQTSFIITNPEIQVVLNKIQSHGFTHAFIPQVSVEHLLYARPCSRHQETTVSETHKAPVLRGLGDRLNPSISLQLRGLPLSDHTSKHRHSSDQQRLCPASQVFH